MKKLWVYADFDWLKEIEPVGELSCESLSGSDNYSFTFEDAWLKRYGNLKSLFSPPLSTSNSEPL